MRVTGLCGGIGAGKSTVARLFEQHGATVIDVDQLGRSVIEPDGRAYAEVVELFGTGILGETPHDAPGPPPIDRASLAAVVFADPTQLDRLESVSHPAINAELDALLVAASAGGIEWVVLDMAVLVESSLGRELPSGHDYDTVVVVEASEATRVARLVDTRGMSAEDAANRIASQTDDAARRAVADVVLTNDGGLDALERRVADLAPRLSRPLGDAFTAT